MKKKTTLFLLLILLSISTVLFILIFVSIYSIDSENRNFMKKVNDRRNLQEIAKYFPLDRGRSFIYIIPYFFGRRMYLLFPVSELAIYDFLTSLLNNAEMTKKQSFDQHRINGFKEWTSLDRKIIEYPETYYNTVKKAGIFAKLGSFFVPSYTILKVRKFYQAILKKLKSSQEGIIILAVEKDTVDMFCFTSSRYNGMLSNSSSFRFADESCKETLTYALERMSEGVEKDIRNGIAKEYKRLSEQ